MACENRDTPPPDGATDSTYRSDDGYIDATLTNLQLSFIPVDQTTRIIIVLFFVVVWNTTAPSRSVTVATYVTIKDLVTSHNIENNHNRKNGVALLVNQTQ